jgi:hypothetical protein
MVKHTLWFERSPFPLMFVRRLKTWSDIWWDNVLMTVSYIQELLLEIL